MSRIAAGLALGVGALALAGGAGAQQAGIGQPVQKFDTVTTLATKSRQDTFEVLGSTTVFTDDQIQTMIPTTLDDVLRIAPNVQADGGPRSTAEEFNIRGMGNQRIVFRVDGARLNFQSGHRGRIFLDPDILKSVAVLRGPSAIYGSGALGGVIGLTVKDAKDFLGPDDVVGWRSKFGADSVSKGWFQSHTLAAQFGGLGILGNFAMRRAGDIKAGPPNIVDSREFVPFSADDIKTGVVKLTMEPVKHHKLFYTFQIYNNDNTIPAAANTDSATLIADRATRERRHVLGYNFRNPANPWLDATARFYYNMVDINERIVSSGADFGRVDVTRFNTYGVDLYNTSRIDLWDDKAKNKLTYGLEFYFDDQTGTRDDTPRLQFPDADSRTLGFYIQNELTLFDKVILLGSLRWDRIQLSASGQPDLTASSLSKTGAIGFRPFDWLMIYGKYAEAFRAPSLTERYPMGVHFSLGPTISNTFIPNPGLKPEKARGWEAGVAVRRRGVFRKDDRLGAKVSVFRKRVDNLIELEVINAFPFGPFTSQSVNIADARLQGLEAEVSYTSKYIFAGVAYGRVQGKNLTNGGSLRSIPADKVVLSVGSRIPQADLLVGWRTSIVGRQNRVPPPPDDTENSGGYATHDIYVSWVPSGRRVKWLKGFRLDLGIDNIANKRYRKHLSELPEAGRNFKVAVSYKIAFGGD